MARVDDACNRHQKVATGNGAKTTPGPQKPNRTVLLLISGALLIGLISFVILIAIDHKKDRSAAERNANQTQAQDSQPKPPPSVISHSRSANSSSSDMFPDVPSVRFDRDGKPIDPLPNHRQR